ncbi:hypothetical protein [Alistipes indistinctus]|uniref:hypothetical protein n=1 Tax=Alistipes indistinctus TaxID=626932 RepID=UPI0026DD5CE4|nr:hypothetical protein [Alistipes indistinctus]
MNKNITEAIKYLPEQLLTKELIEAALEEENICLLDYLPPHLITPEIVNRLVRNNQNSYIGYDLQRLPAHCRTSEICEDAVARKARNFRYVPADVQSRAMLLQLILHTARNLELLFLVRSDLWDMEAVWKAVDSIYGGREGYHRQSSVEAGERMLLRILFSIVPRNLLNRQFYRGLFSHTSLSVQNIDILTPGRFKDKTFYLLLAPRDISLIPKSSLNYEIFREAILSERSQVSYIFSCATFRAAFFELIDDTLADAIVGRFPRYFRDLPKEFRTSKRLLLTIRSQSSSGCGCRDLIDEHDKRLLTKEVCRAFVSSDWNCPQFPKRVWTREFADYCIAHPGQFDWFEQMPLDLQTQQIADAALNYSPYNLKYIRKRFLSPKTAMSLYRRDHGHKRHIQPHYFTDFCHKTGLPEEFWGGEVSLMSLKNNRVSYTYCCVGDTVIGFYHEERYSNSPAHLIMTRRVSRYMKPELVFDIVVGTYHKTWFEKIVADNDPQFVKPKADKTLRDVQAVCYYGVEKLKQLGRTEIYRNTFLGQTIGYCARRHDLTYHADNCNELIEGLKYKIRGMAVPENLTELNCMWTADLLHSKFGFCYTGMGIFAEEYGLDISGAYSVKQLRQVVQEKGQRPSLSRYSRELKKIAVI